MSSSSDIKINNLIIDTLLFTQKFVRGCDIGKCSGECCYYGVYAGLEEYEKILEKKEDIIKLMDASQEKFVENWFEPPVKDSDFKSGLAYGTNVRNGKCVFLDKEGFCTLQKLAMNEGMHKWHYKPLYCILFPVVIVDGKLTIDDHHLNRMHYCNREENWESTAFEACKEEIKYLFNDEDFSKLENIRSNYIRLDERKKAI